MFQRLGNAVSRYWPVVLAVWIALVAGLPRAAPRWEDVTLDGDFAYLPARMTSVRGDRLFAVAFPNELARSAAVLVFARPDGPLGEADYAAIDRFAGLYTPGQPGAGPVVAVLSHQTEVIGRKLTSRPGRQGQASLVFLQLSSEFMAVGNMEFTGELYRRADAFTQSPGWPAGLKLGVTGSAAIGADMLFAAQESISRTEVATIALVMLILLCVYRAPGLVVVPLATIMASVAVAKALVAALVVFAARTGWFEYHVFKTTQIFVVVILYGAGTDFCLFLISRYREELELGRKPARAIARALERVSSALGASALTTIFGLGTMAFADFGKFRSGGPSIALCLAVALVACVTLAPALLRVMGPVVFWPGRIVRSSPGVPPRALSGRFWPAVADMVLARPGLVLLTSVALLTPLAVRGSSVEVTYDLVNELSPDRPSVVGFRLLENYFSPGEIGPVTVLARRGDQQFTESEGQAEIARLTRYLYELSYQDAQGQRVNPIQSVRSLTEPLGGAPGTFNPFTQAGRDKIAVLKHERTKRLYLSPAGPLAGRVTRLDLLFGYDSFSREAVELFNYVERQLRALTEDDDLAALGVLQGDGGADFQGLLAAFAPDQRQRVAALPDRLTGGDEAQLLALARLAPAWHGVDVDFLGTTPGIRDLEQVTASDQRLIRVLVVLAVAAVLVAILGRPVLSVYLILSVIFSYLVTMGVTASLFGWIYGATYRGLDWKVPLFLFVLLVAVGQDYNIYLVTRVVEEQKKHGRREGLRRAMITTGGIITSCGLIMAGTFVSMIAGTLRGMQELGLALSLGILLDTLVIRTVLVPAFMARMKGEG